MIETIQGMTHLLASFSSAAVTFATADNSIAATGIGTNTVTSGEKFVASGPAQAGNNRTFTAVTVTANKIIVLETVTAESAGALVVLNEEYQSGYKQAFNFGKIVGAISPSKDCTAFLDFSDDKINADFTKILPVNAGVPLPIDETVRAHYVQFRVRNNGTTQTTIRAFINGLKG